MTRVWRTGEVVLDQYEVLDVVHGGGMGLVHRVRHRGWQVDLAVKTPRPALVERLDARGGFEAEAETWVNLGMHPHTVSCVYVRRIEELPRVFAEWVDGGSVADAVRDGRLYDRGPATALRRILDVAVQVAWGLEHAHANGLIHQDVKPANVMVDRGWTAKVTDFGLAKARVAGGETAAPPPGMSLVASYGGMTRAYCSPEQAAAAVGAGGSQLTRATDVWSWALTVLEMFNGSMPGAGYGQAGAEALAAFLDGGPARPGPPPMPPAVTDLLRRCLTREPLLRPRRMDPLADELTAIYAKITGEPYPRQQPAPATLLADGLSNQALSMVDLDRVARAEELWEQALRAQPHHAPSVYNRGLHRWRAGQLTDTQLVAELEAVCADEGGDGTGEYLLGLVHLERGALAEAVERLRAVAVRRPADPDVATALAAAEREPADRTPVELHGHTGRVRSVALTAAGLIVSGAGDDQGDYHSSPDGTVRIWDPTTGTCSATLPVDRQRVTAVAVDGALAVTARTDGAVLVWDLSTSRRVQILPGAVRGWGASVDIVGDLAVTGSADGSVRLWHVRTGRCLATWADREEHNSKTEVGLTADGRFVLRADRGRLRVWEVATGLLVRVLESDGTVALSSDRALALLFDQRARELRVCATATGEVVRTLPCDRDWGWTVLDDAGRLAFSNGRRQVWELSAEPRCVRTLAFWRVGVHATALTADGTMAAFGCSDRRVRWWRLPPGPRAPWHYQRPRGHADLVEHASAVQGMLDRARTLINTGRPTEAAEELRAAREQPGHRHRPELLELRREVGRHGRRTTLPGAWQRAALAGTVPIALSADGETAVTADSDANVVVWDVRRGTRRHTLAGHRVFVGCLALSPDGGSVVTGGPDGRLLVWDVPSGQCRHELVGHQHDVQNIVLSADGRVAVTAGSEDHAFVWDLDTGRLLHRLTHRSWPNISISPDGATAMTGDNLYAGPALRIWDLRTGRCRRTRRVRSGLLAITPDGRYALSAGERAKAVDVRNLRTGRRQRTLQTSTSDLRAIAVSPDSSLVLAGGTDRTVSVWDLRTGRQLHRLTGDLGIVESIAVSHDGLFALSAGDDMSVRVWDLRTGACLRVLEGHTGPIRSVALSADGRRALSGGSGGTVLVWELDWDYAFPEDDR
ncbi:protein kinase [Plantactinospora solaniradicis]|uniref:Protein kinase n=1 Tax=Plantactinospora solaniradicis TaxID=1723736 RepID=A0ABW1KP39_9ACTN